MQGMRTEIHFGPFFRRSTDLNYKRIGETADEQGRGSSQACQIGHACRQGKGRDMTVLSQKIFLTIHTHSSIFTGCISSPVIGWDVADITFLGPFTWLLWA